LYRTGLLLIRAWIEKGATKPLRAHIRATTDVANGFQSELTVADVASVSAMVETWLGAIMAAAESDEERAEEISKETKPMTTWELKDLLDLPVVSNAVAKEVGRVHEVLFNPAANALFGLVVSPTEKDGPLLMVPLRGIRSIGKDAVTIESLNEAESFADNTLAQEISAAGGHRTGMNVMTESGDSIGKIDKVTVKEDGTVAFYHSSTGFLGSKHDIEPSEVRSGSKDMIVITDDAREGAVKSIAKPN